MQAEVEHENTTAAALKPCYTGTTSKPTSVKLTSNLKKYLIPQTPFIADKRGNFVDQSWNLFMMLKKLKLSDQTTILWIHVTFGETQIQVQCLGYFISH